MECMDLGFATIDTKKAVAGSYITVRYTYHIGHPIDDTGCIKIVFRYASDFGTPQFVDKKAANYFTIHTTGDCRIEPRWDVKGNTRPWGHTLYLKVMGGYLEKGDTITVIFGDKSGDSPGWQMQTFCEKTFEFKTLVDPIATYQFKELPKSPEFTIVPGTPAHAVCITPSQISVNRKFSFFLKLEDLWGNPIQKPRKHSHVGFSKAGVGRVKITDKKTGLYAISNPIRIVDSTKALPHFYWADFHGQSEETVGSNTIEDYYSFARDYALLDISAHQGNDFQITDEFWDKINLTAKSFYRPKLFVTFPGYEWSGNTPLGGDRNIYFVSEGGKISRSCGDLLPGNKSRFKHSSTAKELFKNLSAQRVKTFAFAHVGGRYANMEMHDDIEVAVEVHSAWGTFDWLVRDALNRGYRIGICANSDGHKGRPGASFPGRSKFGSLGGLTCVLAEKLDRNSIADAMKRRHFYATTGNRCLIDLKVIASSGEIGYMGDVIGTQEKKSRLNVQIVGTAPIERVDVFNGGKRVKTLFPYSKEDLGRRIKIVWMGAEVKGRARMVTWDGTLRVRRNKILGISPINFWNPDCVPHQSGSNRVDWKSVTTGGVCGMILTLEKAGSGIIEMETVQKCLRCSVGSLGISPRRWKCNGIEKQIEIFRLPDVRDDIQFSLSVILNDLNCGDNPIYIRVIQEDGHVAWTSPVYLVKKDKAGK